MTEYDRQYYLCDPRCVNWKEYYILFALGARVYLLRDPITNYGEAQKRMKFLKIAHYFIKYLFILIFGFILLKALNFNRLFSYDNLKSN